LHKLHIVLKVAQFGAEHLVYQQALRHPSCGR
jgi:hypothetical protein